MYNHISCVNEEHQKEILCNTDESKTSYLDDALTGILSQSVQQQIVLSPKSHFYCLKK